MKTRILITALCAAGLLAAAGTASALDTATLGLSAKVNGVCKFDDNTGAIAFNAVTSDAGAQSANNSGDPITFWCTKKANYTITDNSGQHASGTQRRMQHTGDPAEFLPYGLAYTATGTGSGPTSPITLSVTANVLSADLANAAAGDFADTVTFTINP